MKQLTQEIFKNQQERYESAVIDSEGYVWLYECQLQDLDASAGYWETQYMARCKLVDSGYDATDWKNSGINKELSA